MRPTMACPLFIRSGKDTIPFRGKPSRPSNVFQTQGNVWAWVFCRTVDIRVAKLLELKQNVEPPQQGGTLSRPSAGFFALARRSSRKSVLARLACIERAIAGPVARAVSLGGAARDQGQRRVLDPSAPGCLMPERLRCSLRDARTTTRGANVIRRLRREQCRVIYFTCWSGRT